MKIFVGEYVCGGGVVDSPLEQVPLELRREGAAMLRAITQDIAEMADVVFRWTSDSMSILRAPSRFQQRVGNLFFLLGLTLRKTVTQP